MLEMKTKWFSNSLAKQMMSKNDYVLTSDKKRLYVVNFGMLTSSAKNTYNVELRDENENVLSSYENLYLDAITKLILGASPKSKASKEASEEITKETKQTTKKTNKECLYLTFDEALKKACNMIESYKDVAIMLGKYDTKDVSLLALKLINEATIKERQRLKEAKKQEEMQALFVSLDIAKKQGNAMIIDAINEMIANKEKE